MKHRKVGRSAAYLLMALALGAGALSEISAAREPYPHFPRTDADFRLLPPYCKIKMRSPKDSAEYLAWNERLGDGFQHIHHYCAGMNDINIVNRHGHKDSNITRLYLQDALRQFAYVEKHADPNFVLMPEIKVKKGKVHRRLGDDASALSLFQEAIRLNPGYSLAYIALADYYIDIGDKAAARITVNEGLDKVPDSNALKRRLKELGGD